MRGVRGDFAALRTLREAALKIGSGTVGRAVVRQCADEAEALLMMEFSLGEDPYGRRWPRTWGGHQPLRHFGKHVKVTPVPGRGFRVTATHPGARIHQYGGVIQPRRRRALAIPVHGGPRAGGSLRVVRKVVMPERQYVPEWALPRAWLDRFRQVERVELEKVLRR
jgi:hypothetical protein